MGLFGSNIKKIIREIRKMSEYYSNDLSKEINESFEDLKSQYDENSNVVPEFMEFVNQLKPKLDSADANKLEAFTRRISKVDRNAQKGVDALYELSRNQRKMTTENLREIEELELELK
ncbi:hypothetical protein HUK80_14690 [Flavobacterium sp. MAH-1]|uniref:Uncharacterized protein n=1 Tax=Flavobacterium agri TaxID=2743471 RepID=A0A7Y8Y401_9FLAO|nr:hypothetical protein [Flavobacterium agri]NUY82149.1 hypothetical protein [Flavobacterium agri]NYA72173.1 hypothetical protein [Flavobacterium agri]